MRRWECVDEEATRAAGEELGGLVFPNGVLLLSGKLGAGKTVLAKGVARACGVPEEEVQSPTYTLIRDHAGSRTRLLHVDLYRLEETEVSDLGLEEQLSEPGVKVVEWAERLPFPVSDAIEVSIEVATGSAHRTIVATGFNPQGRLNGSTNPS